MTISIGAVSILIVIIDETVTKFVFMIKLGGNKSFKDETKAALLFLVKLGGC